MIHTDKYWYKIFLVHLYSAIHDILWYKRNIHIPGTVIYTIKKWLLYNTFYRYTVQRKDPIIKGRVPYSIYLSLH
jgi:hypothetical protein